MKPIIDMLDKRKAMVADSIKGAKEARAEMTSMQAEKERLVQEARKEAKGAIDAASSEAAAIRAEASQAAQAEAAAIVERTKKELDRERQAMVASAKSELADVVVRATSAVVQEQLDARLQKTLAKQALKKVTQE